jgi:hypothetical protein
LVDGFAEFRKRQQDVRELVGEALSLDLEQLDAEIDHPIGARLDDTAKVFMYVSRKMAARRPNEGVTEPTEKLNTGLALVELRRLDSLDGRDPDDRLTDGYREWLLGWTSELEPVTTSRPDAFL